MPSISSELTTFIKATATVTAIIGAGVACKFYNRAARQRGDLPYVVYMISPGSSDQHLLGMSGMTSRRIEIVSYEETEDKAETLDKAIRISLQGKRQLLGSTLVVEHGGGSPDQGRYEKSVGNGRPEYWQSHGYIFSFLQPIS